MKSSSLINKEICGWKEYFSDLNSVKEINYFYGIFLKNIFAKEDILSLTKSQIKDELNLVTKKYISDEEESFHLNSSLLIKKILRYQKWEESNSKGCTFKKADVFSIVVHGHKIKVDYHFIKIDDINKTITVYKVRNKKNPLKLKGRTPFTAISKNKELFLLQSVGRALYPDYKSFGAIVFLSNSLDKKNVLSEKFETFHCENVVIKNYTLAEIESLELEIFKIINDTYNKCNKSTECINCQYSNICNYVDKDLSKIKKIPVSDKASKVEFTPDQKKFISVEKGVYRILAGAGSGKTTVIANNVIELLKKGVLTRDILLITFTNKGVLEIKEKIEYWIRKNKLSVDVKELNICTFNGFSYELIKKEYLKLGYTKSPQVIDKIDEVELLKSILAKFPLMSNLNYLYPFMDLPNAKGSIMELRDIFNKMKSFGLTFVSDVEAEFNVNEETAIQLIKMYNEYYMELKNRNLIEINDQVDLAYRLLCDKEILEKYGYGHIICDEFQDSDSLQINILLKLYKYKYIDSLCICGDDSQVIFGWRGAEKSNLINFHQYIPETIDIKMTKNFRSTREICNFANHVNALNESSIPKNITSDKSGSLPILKIGDVSSIIDLVKEDIKNGYKPQDIAIISRNKKSLILSQNLLSEAGVQSIIAVSEQLIDNYKVKNLIGFSNFLLDETLDLHFAEYLQVVKYDEFMKFKEKDLKEFIKDEKEIFLNSYSKLTNDTERLDFFYKLLTDVSKRDNSVEKLLQYILKCKFSKVSSMVKYLNNLNLYKVDYFVEKSYDQYEAVTLTTAHSSKGREYNKVYINISDFKTSLNSEGYNEEEIRLFFVAITRAKKELVMIGIDNPFYKKLQSFLD